MASMFFEPSRGRKGLFHNKPLEKAQTAAPVKNQWPPKTLKHFLDKYGWRILGASLFLFLGLVFCIFLFSKNETILLLWILLAFTSWAGVCWMVYEISPKKYTIFIPVVFGGICFVTALRITTFKEMVTKFYNKGESFVFNKLSTEDNSKIDSIIKIKVDSFLSQKQKHP